MENRIKAEDIKILNDSLREIFSGSYTYNVNLVKTQQTEDGETKKIYHIHPLDLYVKLAYMENSYGGDDVLSSVSFVKAKKVETVEYIAI